MANDETNGVAQNEVEAVTTQVSSPATEAAPTEPQTTDVETSTPEVSESLPDDKDEERRAFQQMRLENKRLKEQVEGRVANESAFNVFRPQPVAPLNQVDVNQYYDQVTGEVNWQAYNAAVINNARTTAQAEAARTTQEMIDENNARTKYPEVFADPDLEEIIASKYLFNKMRGQDVSIEELARKESTKTKQALTQAEKQGAERALTEVTAKEQASLQAQAQTSSPARQSASAEEIERLSVLSRGRGRESDDAIATRLSKLNDLKR